MRKAGITVAVVLVLLIGSFYLVPQIAFHFAKVRARKGLHTDKTPEGSRIENAELNSVPQSPPKKIASAVDYTNTVWMNGLGFPGDRFTHDSDPRRQNHVLHGARYRILRLPDDTLKEWAPVLQLVNETNLFDFAHRAFHTTESDIDRQKDNNGLQRCLILLESKRMLAAVGYTDSCIEFDRGDFKGFVIGDPVRRKGIYVRIYVDGGQRFITLGIIQEKHIQFSEVEELISTIKTRPDL